MRVARVVPSRIATLPLQTSEGFGIGSLYQYLGWSKDWLWVEGLGDPDTLSSLNFQFETLDYPHEWYAKNLRPGVMLRVGSTCQCRLGGIAAYTKIDETAWLRLQFEQCFGCESRAEHAAVVIGLQPSFDLDSSLFQWMCAVNPHGVCAPPNTTVPPTTPTLPPSTSAKVPTTTTMEPTTTTMEPTTTTTRNPACSSLSVDTDHVALGDGKCVGTPVVQEKVAQEFYCALACNMRYLQQQEFYMNTNDMNEHITEINAKSEVCKGFAYNSKDNSCIIYTGEAVNSYHPETDWKCFGGVQAKPNGYEEHFDYSSPKCTTLPPEMLTTSTLTTTSVTTTTVTSTSTATSTTRTTTETKTIAVAALSLEETFEVGDPTAKVFGFPGDVHFQKEGMAATLLQLQSKNCFDNVDYYMLSGTLPVLDAHWDSLMKLLKDVGAPDAWSDQREQCAASATVDRIPVDANIFKNVGSSRITWFGKFLCTVLAVGLVSLLGMGLATWGKCNYYPTGIPQPHKMNGTMFISYVVIAVLAASLAFILVYLLGLIVCWFADRLATRKLAMGGSGAFLLMTPVLAKLCLPVASTAAGATLVIWLWPAAEQAPKRLNRKHNLLISYDPINGEIKPMISS